MRVFIFLRDTLYIQYSDNSDNIFPYSNSNHNLKLYTDIHALIMQVFDEFIRENFCCFLIEVVNKLEDNVTVGDFKRFRYIDTLFLKNIL